MDHTFDTVDEKAAEAEFFLRKMVEANADMFAFNCYLSAFLSASRTMTLALQQFEQNVPGFQEWYRPHQEKLRKNKLAKFFLDTRNKHIHGGPYPVAGGRFHMGEANYFFPSSSKKHRDNPDDIVSACRHYFIELLRIIYDCYDKLGIYIDPQQYFTKENFASQGRNIDDAECEVFGWVCTSLIEGDYSEDDRWHELRSHVEDCKINHLFYSYLGKSTPQPLEPEHYQDFDFTPEEKGWIYIPAGFDSIEAYQTYLDQTNRKGRGTKKT